jgi:hypothetical protein
MVYRFGFGEAFGKSSRGLHYAFCIDCGICFFILQWNPSDIGLISGLTSHATRVRYIPRFAVSVSGQAGEESSLAPHSNYPPSVPSKVHCDTLTSVRNT